MKRRLVLAVPAGSFEDAVIAANDLLDARETEDLRFGPPEVLEDPRLRQALAERFGGTDFYGFVAAVIA
ncbi:hypothetical protein K8O93_00705 [Gordonia bronchialis]|uniref:hypothetical protein n=1 Tax=Gordonia bronchialis TaxID=2054 RepID=UPI001CBE1D52|nr:hypothetical protein [Gordonia bronchialis]UAK38353.1 hypothetical protein K8O93_00705 [Gordonia bronchialis]